jgi:putative ABC transport system ATP-binding protein
MPLAVEGVTKTYARGTRVVRALDDVTFSVAPGELVAVVGASGSGKSTLLHLAGALDTPDRGAVRIDGVSIGTLGRDARADLRRKRIGFIFQFFNLLPTMTVAENVALPFALDGRRTPAGRVEELLDRVGLGGMGGANVHELSGGEMQRVAVARALVASPALVLADEPTGNLDSAAGAQVLDVLDRCHDEGQSVVLVTHDRQAARRADRVVTLRDGRIV